MTMGDAQPDLAAEVFACLGAVLRERAADVRAFVTSGYSFESWLLWEWAARCWRRPGWATAVEPAYRAHGLEGATLMPRGDLLVADGAARVWVELAIMHDWTGEKWYTAGGKLACDRARLVANTGRGHALLQVVVVASKGADIRASASWRRAFERSGCWATAPDLETATPLEPDGQALALGWRVEGLLPRAQPAAAVTAPPSSALGG